jgi:hypothetical protein
MLFIQAKQLIENKLLTILDTRSTKVKGKEHHKRVLNFDTEHAATSQQEVSTGHAQ